MNTALLINPPTPKGRKFTRNISCAAESKGNYLLKPLDFTILSGILKQKYQVKFLDLVSKPMTMASTVEKIKSLKPSFVIIAIIDTIFKNDLNFLIKLKDELPELEIYVLGDAFIEDKNCEKVAPYTRGIIAEPFKVQVEDFQFLRSNRPGFRDPETYKKISKVPTELEIPTPMHELFDDKFYRWPFSKESRYATVTTVWGCPYSCSYCTASNFPVHIRSVENVINELKYIKNLKFKELYITDLSFGLPLKRTITLLDEIIKLQFNFSWSTYFHPLQFNKKLLSKMKEAGCHTIIIGIETTNADILKKYSRNQNLTKIKELINFCHSINIKVCGDFLIGLKEQNKDEVLMNIETSISLKLDYASFNIVAPLPGTVIKKEAQSLAISSDSGVYYDSLGREGIIELQNWKKEDILMLRNSSIKKFYLRPLFLLKSVLKAGNIKSIRYQALEFLHLIRKTIFPSK